MSRLLIFFIILPVVLVFCTSCLNANGNEYSILTIKKELERQDARLQLIQAAVSSNSHARSTRAQRNMKVVVRPTPLVGDFHIKSQKLLPGDYERYITVNGLKRRYEFHLPKGPGSGKNQAWPLVLNFHGGGGRGGTIRFQSGMDKTADRYGFVVVYPDGTGGWLFKHRLLTWNAGDCCGSAVRNNVDDVAFSRALLDDIAKFVKIDQKRIYATGLSNGAMFAQRLACEMADRIAAVAAISGVIGVDECTPSRPISILEIHGTADQNLPYNGGVGARSITKVDFRSVKETINGWRKRNGCAIKGGTKRIGDATIETYISDRGTEVVLVTIDQGGHNWPGGRKILAGKKTGKISRDISANDMMWKFFVRHPMP